ncbi:MAG: hypothetical protein WAK07_14235, partial [Rhodomicrobium sp.]
HVTICAGSQVQIHSLHAYKNQAKSPLLTQNQMLAQKSCRKFGLRKLHALRLDEFSKTCLAGQGNASYRVARFWHGAGPRTSSTGAVRRHNKLRFWPMKADEAQEGELLEWLPVARSRVERHPAADVPTHYGASRWDCALGLNTSPKRATRRSRPPTWQSRMLAGQGPRTADSLMIHQALSISRGRRKCCNSEK